MKKIILFSIGAIIATSSFAQAKKDSAAKPKAAAPSFLISPIDSFSYAVGINIATNMKDQGITNVNLSVMSKAFEDVFKEKKCALTPDEARMTLQQKLKEYSDNKAKEQKSKGEEFLANNKKRKEVVTLPSGLQYEILKAGIDNNLKPTKEDTVVVDYVGTLIDGKEFDNSLKRGEPATFPLGGVIKGWTEILQLMTVGAHWKVFIPSDLGYGERGAGGTIPPNSVLVFEITLKQIKPAVKQ